MFPASPREREIPPRPSRHPFKRDTQAESVGNWEQVWNPTSRSIKFRCFLVRSLPFAIGDMKDVWTSYKVPSVTSSRYKDIHGAFERHPWDIPSDFYSTEKCDYGLTPHKKKHYVRN